MNIQEIYESVCNSHSGPVPVGAHLPSLHALFWDDFQDAVNAEYGDVAAEAIDELDLPELEQLASKIDYALKCEDTDEAITKDTPGVDEILKDVSAFAENLANRLEEFTR